MARNRGATKRRGNVISVNFKGVEGRITLPEGSYHCKVAEVTQEDGSQAPYLKWKFEVVGGKFDGKPLYNNTSLAEQSLWSLRNLLETLGVEVPDDELDIDLEELVGKECMLVVEHENYEGKTRARVADFSPLGEDEGGDEEDEPKSKKESKVKDDGEVPFEEEEDDEPKSRKRKGRRSRDEEEEEEEEDDDEPKSRKSKRLRDEDEDEDDEPKSKKKAGKSSKKKSAPTADEISDFTEDELEELNDEYGLNVKLDRLKTLTKKRNAIIDALEDSGQLAA